MAGGGVLPALCYNLFYIRKEADASFLYLEVLMDFIDFRRTPRSGV